MIELKRIEWICGIAIVLSVAGCKPSAKPAAPPPRPPVEVGTFEAISKPTIDHREFTGRTTSINSVELRARVSGYLVQCPGRSNETFDDSAGTSEFRVTAREGDRIKKGTPLFEIDPKPYRIALQQAEGDLSAAESQLVRLAAERQRAVDLVKTNANAISKSDFDLAIANYSEAAAKIETLKAVVSRAKLDLEFTQVVAPVDGLLSYSLVTRGNLIAADTTILTTIVSINPMYVYFNVDETSVLDYRALVRQGKLKSARDTTIPVELALANEEDFSYAGSIDFVNNTTDPQTGNTIIRGVFPNDSGALSPGLFARIRAPFSAEYEAILIPTAALAMDQEGRYVMLVGPENKVERRNIKIGVIQGHLTVVTEGLKPKEVVIVTGLQKIRPGATVDPKPFELPEDSPKPAATTKKEVAS